MDEILQDEKFARDRMSLSEKNDWFDKDSRVYIYYTVDEICGDMNCGRDKAMKLLAELDTSRIYDFLSKSARIRRNKIAPKVLALSSLNTGLTTNDLPSIWQVVVSSRGSSLVICFAFRQFIFLHSDLFQSFAKTGKEAIRTAAGRRRRFLRSQRHFLRVESVERKFSSRSTR